jgi:SAM-dependent methyltransferase
MKELQCCAVSCEKPLDKDYWDSQYKANTIAWDLGGVSPAIKIFIDTLKDKNSAILIPGCGNSYEAEYLIKQGFTNITIIDIAPSLVENLQCKFVGNSNVKIILGDFFEHQGNYDLIIEQTFFCALPPTMRQKYVYKMHQLLTNSGKIIGLLFNRSFEKGPPFGGSKEAYTSLFKDSFAILKMENCENSIAPRAQSELFIALQKNPKFVVNLYEFEGITCNGCKNSVLEKIATLNGVKNGSMNSTFSELLIVSTVEIAIAELQHLISDDEKYTIKKVSEHLN